MILEDAKLPSGVLAVKCALIITYYTLYTKRFEFSFGNKSDIKY